MWIDDRYRRTDRTLLNPLGGIPWSDYPDWPNNDILSISVEDLIRTPQTATPEILTPNMSYASRLRTRVAGDKVYVMWVGRKKVGKNLDSAGAPPAVFYTTASLRPN